MIEKNELSEVELSEVIRNWAIVIGGTIGVLLAIWRGIAADRQSRASRSQAEIARRAHTTEVFKDAVQQLSNERLEIRLGAIFTLRRISYDFPEFRYYVFQLLTTYLKEQTTGADPNLEPRADIREIVEFLRSELTSGDEDDHYSD